MNDNKKIRLSPLFIILKFFSNYRLFIPIIFIFRDDSNLKYFFILGIFVLNFIVMIISYFKTYYEIKDDTIIYTTGIFTRSEKYINFSNIQNVDTTQNFLHQIFNLVSLDINIITETVKLSPLTRKEANRLISLINKTENIVVEPKLEEKNIYLKLNLKDLFLLSLAKANIVVTFFVVLAFGDDISDIFKNLLDIDATNYLYNYTSGLAVNIYSILYFVTLFIIMLFIISFVATFIKFYNFSLENKEDKLILKYGLFSKKALIIKKDRIQKVIISQPLRFRLLNLASVEITTTSKTSIDDFDINSILEIIPMASKDFSEKFVKEILKIDIDSYEKEEYDKIPNKAKSIIIKWEIVKNFLVLVFLAGLGYFIPVFKERTSLFINVSLFIIFIVVIYSVLSYKNRITFTKIALNKDMIIYKNTFGLTTKVSYLKPLKVGNISFRTNVFLKRRNLCNITVNTIGEMGDIFIYYFEKEFGEKLKNYFLEKEEKFYE